MTTQRTPADLPKIPLEHDAPIFKEPWEAQVFALALQLHEAGVYTWDEWSQALSAEIKRAEQHGEPNLGDTYYQHWLSALEKLLVTKGQVKEVDLEHTQAKWRQAYSNTPHGKPVSLEAAD